MDARLYVQFRTHLSQTTTITINNYKANLQEGEKRSINRKNVLTVWPPNAQILWIYWEQLLRVFFLQCTKSHANTQSTVSSERVKYIWFPWYKTLQIKVINKFMFIRCWPLCSFPEALVSHIKDITNRLSWYLIHFWKHENISVFFFIITRH